MNGYVNQLIDEVGSWEEIDVNPHRFGGREFNLGNVEIGHVHSNGMVDIPFTRSIREQLLKEGQAEPHHLLPETGWITYYMRNENNLAQAVRLFNLSYIQKARSRNRKSPERLDQLAQQLDALGLSEDLRALIK